MGYDRIVVYSNSDMEIKFKESSMNSLSIQIIGLVGKKIRELCDESKNCYPISAEFWTSERDGELFRKLMIDENSDPSKCFATIESSIIDVAMQTLMNRK